MLLLRAKEGKWEKVRENLMEITKKHNSETIHDKMTE